MPDTAQFILERLHEWSVKRIYGYPGDGINGLMGAFHHVGDRIEFVQTRHEEIAAFAACAHAKFIDHQPVVAIVGQQKRMPLGANYQQEIDLNTLFKDVASEYLMTVMDPTQARHVIDREVRIARAARSVTAVIVPEDVQEASYEEPPRMRGAGYSSLGVTEPVVRPKEEELRRAAEVLNAGSKVAMLIGQGAARAADEVVQVAELLGAGLEVQHVTGGCCSLAGSWGFEHGHHDISMACGDQALLPAVRDAPEDTLVVADGFSCKTQIEQAGTGRGALHVAQVIKMAREHGPDGYRGGRPEAPYYGRRPEPARAVRARRLAVAAAGGLAGAAAVATAAVRR